MLQQNRLPIVVSQCCVPSHCGMFCVQSSTLVCRMHMSGVSGHLSGDCRRNHVRNISATLVCRMHMSKSVTTFKDTVDGIKFATSVHAHKPYAACLLSFPCPSCLMLCCIKRSQGEVRRNTPVTQHQLLHAHANIELWGHGG